MGFAPEVFRLDKGFTELNFNGRWENWGYGIFSMYKSDFVKVGGYDTVKFTTKWGAEDNDIVDR